MRFHKIQAVGPIHVELVEYKPTWQPSDEGRVILVTNERCLYYATDEMWVKSSGMGFNPIYVDRDYVADVLDMCLVDTRNGPVNITLPPNPKEGGEIKIVDICGCFESNPCTLLRNGNLIQRLEKNLVLDINDLNTSIIFNKLGVPHWSISLTGVNQLVGNATVFVHKHLVKAENVDGNGGQKQFTLPWKYNPTKDNIMAYIDGVCQFSFEKTNTESITFDETVPAGCKVLIVSVPIEAGFNIDRFATVDDLLLYVKKSEYRAIDVLNKILTVDGAGSGLDADLLDGRQGDSFVYVENYKDSDILNKIKNVDGAGSGLDADLLDGRHARTAPVTTDVSTRANLIPVARDTGTLDPLWLPFGRGGVEFVSSYTIPAGQPSVLDIRYLENPAGHLIYFKNIRPTISNTKLYAKVFNESSADWDVLRSWTTEYSTNLSGVIRDFNTWSDMLLADHVGDLLLGFNGVLHLTGFSMHWKTGARTIQSNIHFLSAVNDYATMYRGIGVMPRSSVSYSGVRLYFSSGYFDEGGTVTVLKINETME